MDFVARGRRVVFYGLPSELRGLSARAPGDPLFVDEVLYTAYPAAEVGRAAQPDSLTPVVSLKEAIASATDIVFAPRYRSIEDPEARLQEIRSHLEVLAPFLDERVLINALPVGPGEGSQIEEFIAGRIGRRPRYVYAPVGPDGSVRYIGVREGDAPEWLLRATKGEVLGVEEAEAAHIGEVLSRSIPAIVRGVTGSGPPTGYMRDAFMGALESFLLGANADPGSSAYSLYTLVKRALEEYLKRLTSLLKDAIRGSGMKVSRARLLVLWTPDEGSARGDERWALEKLKGALSSSFVDVEFAGIEGLRGLERRDVIIVCTRRDEESLSRIRLEGRIMVRALYPRPEVGGLKAA